MYTNLVVLLNVDSGSWEKELFAIVKYNLLIIQSLHILFQCFFPVIHLSPSLLKKSVSGFNTMISFSEKPSLALPGRVDCFY